MLKSLRSSFLTKSGLGFRSLQKMSIELASSTFGINLDIQRRQGSAVVAV